MKNPITALTVAVAFLFASPAAAVADEGDPISCADYGYPSAADCPREAPPLCVDAPDDPECTNPVTWTCDQTANDYRASTLAARVDELTAEVNDLAAQRDRLRRIADRRAEKIAELRAKIRALR